MKKRLVAVLVAGMFALPTAGASSAVAIRSTDLTPSTVLAPSFDNCDQMHRRWQYGVAKVPKGGPTSGPNGPLQAASQQKRIPGEPQPRRRRRRYGV